MFSSVAEVFPRVLVKLLLYICRLLHVHIIIILPLFILLLLEGDLLALALSLVGFPFILN